MICFSLFSAAVTEYQTVFQKQLILTHDTGQFKGLVLAPREVPGVVIL